MTYRPLADWLAVQPFPPEGSKWIIQPKLRGVRFIRGTVLAAGPLATIKPGTVVWYEAHSAHPGQTDALPGELFGGDGDVFLVRAPLESAPSSEADDVEFDRTQAEIDRLRSDWRGIAEKNIPKAVRQQMGRLQRRQASIEAGRASKRRSRRMGHTSDTAVREGVFAVEESS